MALVLRGNGVVEGLTDLPAGSVTAADLASGAITTSALPVGSVLQVVSTTKTDTFSSVAATFTDITGLSVLITPTSSSSKILVMYNVCTGESNAQFPMLRLVRNSTAISIGDASGNRQRTTTSAWTTGAVNTHTVQSMTFLDSPASTSALTYKIQILGEASQTNYINRIQRDYDQGYEQRSVSSITVMEIAG